MNREQTRIYLHPVIHAEVRRLMPDERAKAMAEELVAEAVLDGYTLSVDTVLALILEWRAQLRSEFKADEARQAKMLGR